MNTTLVSRESGLALYVRRVRLTGAAGTRLKKQNQKAQAAD